jgi:hypothetical protein
MQKYAEYGKVLSGASRGATARYRRLQDDIGALLAGCSRVLDALKLLSLG